MRQKRVIVVRSPLLEKGVPDVIPDFIGNVDLKQVLLWAMCRYDKRYPDFITGLVAIARSGEGKTWLLRCLDNTGLFECDIFNRDALTPASMGTVKGKKPVKIEMAPVSCFDELDKWSTSYISTLLQIFGKEESQRARGGLKFKVKSETLPIGTLLTSWKTFERQEGGANTTRRIHALEQLLRRVVIIKLDSTTEDPEMSRLYVEKVMDDHFWNIHIVRDFNSEENRELLMEVLERAGEIAENGIGLLQKDSEKVRDYVDQVRRKIYISETVSYAEEFPHLVFNLAIGRALSEGREMVEFEDVEVVGELLWDHAQRLGMIPPKEKKKMVVK